MGICFKAFFEVISIFQFNNNNEDPLREVTGSKNKTLVMKKELHEKRLTKRKGETRKGGELSEEGARGEEAGKDTRHEMTEGQKEGGWR